jgi:hypothetical protein
MCPISIVSYLLYFVTCVYLEVKKNVENNFKEVVQLILKPFAARKEGFVAEANVADKD